MFTTPAGKASTYTKQCTETTEQEEEKKKNQNTQILYTKQALKIGARRSWKLVVPTNITDQNKMALKYLGFWNI